MRSKQMCCLTVVISLLINNVTTKYTNYGNKCINNTRPTNNSSAVCIGESLPNFTYEIRENSPYGILDVNISYPSLFQCGVNTIHLYVNESVTKSECNSDTIFNRDELRYHTDHEFCTQSNNYIGPLPTICDEKIAEEYWFVFTGCYQVKLIKFERNEFGWYAIYFNTPPFWVESSYEKQPLALSAPTASYKRNLEESKTHIYLTYSRLDMLLLKNEIYFQTYNVTSSNIMQKYCVQWYIGDKIISNTGIANNEKIPISQNCNMEGYNNTKTCTFNTETKVIDCLFNVPNFTMYKILLRAYGPLCKGMSLWRKTNKDCEWYLKQNSSNVKSDQTFPQQQSKFSIYKIIVPVGIVVIFLLALLIYCKWFLPKHYVFIKRNRKIFLLYPRDCEQPFPEVIKLFTELLNHLGNFEIYDMWNLKYAEAMELSPKDWVQYKIEESDFIIYIPTHRGEILYESSIIFNGDIKRLQQKFCMDGGQAFDHYFLYAYKLSSTKTNFINIEFSDLAIGLKSTIMKSNGTTFKIPKGMKKLCKHLRVYQKDCIKNNKYYNSMIEGMKEAKILLSDKTERLNNPFSLCVYCDNNKNERF